MREDVDRLFGNKEESCCICKDFRGSKIENCFNCVQLGRLWRCGYLGTRGDSKHLYLFVKLRNTNATATRYLNVNLARLRETVFEIAIAVRIEKSTENFSAFVNFCFLAPRDPLFIPYPYHQILYSKLAF